MRRTRGKGKLATGGAQLPAFCKFTSAAGALSGCAKAFPVKPTIEARKTKRGRSFTGGAGAWLCTALLFPLLCTPSLWAQAHPGAPAPQQRGTVKPEVPAGQKRFSKNLFNLLNMAGTRSAAEFTPLTQGQRNRIYFHSLVNPLGIAGVGFSAGISQWGDTPEDWEQGASGFGKRFGNIYGQYFVGRTVNFGLSSILDEDNQYYNSGKHGFWRRTWYAVTSGVLARHHDGHRSISISEIGGVAAGAFISRAWLPKSQNSAGDGAVAFGLTMAGNAGANVFKEFLPDIVHVLFGKRRSIQPAAAAQ